MPPKGIGLLGTIFPLDLYETGGIFLNRLGNSLYLFSRPFLILIPEDMSMKTDCLVRVCYESQSTEIGGVHERRRCHRAGLGSRLTFRASAQRVFSTIHGLALNLGTITAGGT